MNVESETSKVLLTGDYEFVRDNVALDDEGLRTVTATVDEVPSVVEDEQVDCVVSGKDIDVLERLHAVGTEPPFVLVSDGSTTPAEAADSGVSDYIEAPTREGEGRIAARRIAGQAERHLSERLGYSADEIIGAKVSDTEVEIDRDELEELWQEYEYGEPIVVEGRKRRKDGTEFPVEVNVGKAKVGDDEVFLAISRDTTERKKREQEIEDSRRHLRQVIDLVPDYIFAKKRSGEYILANEAIAEVYGLSPEEIEGKTGFEIGLDEDEVERFREDDREVIDSGESKFIPEETLTTVEGDERILETRKIPFEPATLGETAVLGHGRDITELKERERELEKYEQIVNNAREVLWMFEPDFSETIIVNSNYEEKFGQPVEDIEEDPMSFVEAVHPDDRELVRETVDAISRGETVDIEVRVNPEEDYERWVWIQGEPVYEDGEFVAVAGFTRDITERKKRKEELERYEAYVNSTADIITHLDEDGTMVYQSPSVKEVLGIDPEDRIGEDVFDYVHPEDREYALEEFTKLAEEERNIGRGVEIRLRHADGSYVWMSISGRYGTTEEIDGVLLSSTDITERKKREQELREKNESLEEREDQLRFFNDVLAEKVLGSMNYVRGNSEAALERLSDDAAVRPELESIKSRTNRVIDAVNRVNSTISAVVGDAELTSQDLSDIIRARTRYAEVTRDAEIDAEVPRGTEVLADDFLDEVVETLVVNAVEHNDKEEPRVEVTVNEGDGMATVRVADNGPGVPDGMKDRIFEPGVKGDDSGGVGLGLYFVDSMVGVYGGDVYVEDNEPEGSVFVLELPLAEE